MRITYVTHTRFPTEKAHGHQVAHVCQAMAALGHDVTLVAPTVKNAIGVAPQTYYGMKPTFKVVHMKNFDALNARLLPGFLGFAIGIRWSYVRQLKKFLRTHQTDLFYARSPVVLRTLFHTKTPVILELHTLPKRGRGRFVKLCRACKQVVCLTKLMAKDLIAAGLDRKKISVESDGVDLARFRNLPTHTEAKKKAKNFSDSLPVIGYVGSFFTQRKIEKGIPVLLEALAILRKRGVEFHGLLCGGRKNEIERYHRDVRQMGLDQTVLFHGHLTTAEVPLQLAACDILVYPAPDSKHPFFQRDTSPLKLFEYLAAGRPIVCADLPPLREVVADTVVYFFTPGDARSLAHQLAHVLAHPSEARKKAERGLAHVKQFDWKKRMERILA